MAKQILTPVDRFMMKVEPEPNSGCWLWCAADNGSGYGVINLREGDRKYQEYAHRFSYTAFIGPIPKDMMVLHRCDVRACVNPEHLFIGSAQDNQGDMARKHRGCRSMNGLPYGVRLERRWSGLSRPYYARVRYRTLTHHLGWFREISTAADVAETFRSIVHLTGSVDEARHGVAALLAAAKVNTDFSANVNTP